MPKIPIMYAIVCDNCARFLTDSCKEPAMIPPAELEHFMKSTEWTHPDDSVFYCPSCTKYLKAWQSKEN